MVRSSTQHRGSIGSVAERGIPDEVDVAVVGSGGAGLMAALTATVIPRSLKEPVGLAPSSLRYTSAPVSDES